jgi:uncharacterized membrane protein YgcG
MRAMPLIKVLSVLLAFLACAPAALADERILSFDETITVRPDGSLEVRETLRVRAEGRNIRRGIYRDFPTSYAADGGRQIVVGFKFVSATRNGLDEPWRTEPRGNGVRVYLGSANVMLDHAEHTYELVYRTDRQMGYFADHDELYWNVTGNGWDFEIDRATARVILPGGIPAGSIKLEAYTGAQGEKGTNYRASLENGVPLFTTTRSLRPREGLTIVVMWPKGFVTAAIEESVPIDAGPTSSPGYDFAKDAGSAPRRPGRSPIEALLGRDLPKNNLPAFFALFGLAALLLYYYWMWTKVGRDPPSRITIPEYESPKGQSPASMRFLLRMGYDNECFAAAVLSLAVKGRLRIQQNAGVLGLGKTFTLIKEPASNTTPMSADEEQLLLNLFSGGDTLVLKQENHVRVSEARKNHRLSLKDRFSSGFFNINGGWHILGIALSVLLALPALMLPGQTDVWPAWHFTTLAGWFTGFVVLVMLATNGLFGMLLKAPTLAGQAVMDHIRGFKMYLEVAEGEELKRMKTPPPPLTPQLYESYLPAALALDVEQRWAERFADVLNVQAPNYSPAWYVGPAFNIRDMGGFSRDLGSSLGQAISASSQAPGSSSGGGGGGSSGGGGGGGGGGGW